MFITFAFGSLAFSALASSARAAYSLEVEYQGETFFQGWDFYGNRDNLTNGELLALLASSAAQLADAFSRCRLLRRREGLR